MLWHQSPLRGYSLPLGLLFRDEPLDDFWRMLLILLRFQNYSSNHANQHGFDVSDHFSLPLPLRQAIIYKSSAKRTQQVWEDTPEQNCPEKE
jgi:hypothetical protein